MEGDLGGLDVGGLALAVEELALLVKDNLFSKHLLLSVEEALVNFLEKDTSSKILELQPMAPYHRLLVHRLADIFGFAHESIGEGDDRHLILERCPDSSIPPIFVNDILWKHGDCQTVTTVQITKRDSLADSKKKEPSPSSTSSLKEREAAYLAARERIFAMHIDEEKEHVSSKPRNVPVVARRMIAHALGKNIAKNALEHNHCLTSRKEYDSSESSQEVGKSTFLSTSKNVQKSEGKLYCEPAGRTCHSLNLEVPKKLTNCPNLNKVVLSSSNRKVVGGRNLEKEQFGAAKRMFANALGLPSPKDSKCTNQAKIAATVDE